MIELIRREIAAAGVLPFARFMELALYCPNYGYYQTKRDNPGRRGDFFTSVSVGELFGQLLAFRFADWLEELDSSPVTRHPPLYLIEAGAHDGTLAGDILNWLQANRPNLFPQLQYCIIEPSPAHQEWQKEKLGKFISCIRWFSNFESLKLENQDSELTGIIFSNELLDAMPVHRFGWDAADRKWFEWGVARDGEKFIWTKIPSSKFRIPNSEPLSALRNLPSELLAVLPDGYSVEISPAAKNWWREAAEVLTRGWLMTADYGLDANELFAPSRPRGTLRAYFRHHIADDVLANPGEQDITAHVNFPAIQAAGESAGLATEGIFTQAQFLTRILETAARDKSFGDWNTSRTRQFQTLTHPEHLGRTFRVLIQFTKSRPIRRLPSD